MDGRAGAAAEGVTSGHDSRKPTPPVSRPKLLFRRFLLALAFGFAVLWPLYLAVANVWLHRGGLERMLNRRPERLAIHWKSAWTVWPGVVHVRGFELRNQTRVYQWWVAVDRGTVDVDLWNLQNRELEI